MRQARGRRPDSGPEDRGAAIFVLWQEEEVAVYLDTTGETLARRGYRKMSGQAPMQETLAAATLLATGWRDGGPLVNPMCGSGTLAIEAALLGLGRAPGLPRRRFAFMHLKDFDASVWEGQRRAAEDAARDRLVHPVVATDLDPAAIRSARINAAEAGVEDLIEWGTCDFARTDVPAPPVSPGPPERGGATVILNPEYGERMGKAEDLGETYARIGDFFKQRCQGYRGYVFTGNPDLAKRIGLRTKRRIPFWNGKIECRLLEYELYGGTRRPPADEADGVGVSAG
jgi:putative N6-adenine-specific DNA methylase